MEQDSIFALGGFVRIAEQIKQVREEDKVACVAGLGPNTYSAGYLHNPRALLEETGEKIQVAALRECRMVLIGATSEVLQRTGAI